MRNCSKVSAAEAPTRPRPTLELDHALRHDGDCVARGEVELETGRDPVLITRATLRPFLAEAIAGVIPNAAVLSYQETAPAKKAS